MKGRPSVRGDGGAGSPGTESQAEESEKTESPGQQPEHRPPAVGRLVGRRGQAGAPAGLDQHQGQARAADHQQKNHGLAEIHGLGDRRALSQSGRHQGHQQNPDHFGGAHDQAQGQPRPLRPGPEKQPDGRRPVKSQSRHQQQGEMGPPQPGLIKGQEPAEAKADPHSQQNRPDPQPGPAPPQHPGQGQTGQAHGQMVQDYAQPVRGHHSPAHGQSRHPQIQDAKMQPHPEHRQQAALAPQHPGRLNRGRRPPRVKAAPGSSDHSPKPFINTRSAGIIH